VVAAGAAPADDDVPIVYFRRSYAPAPGSE
jgi:hypothetical protein